MISVYSKTFLPKSDLEHQLTIITNSLFIRDNPLLDSLHGEFSPYPRHLIPLLTNSGNEYEVLWTLYQIRSPPPSYPSFVE